MNMKYCPCCGNDITKYLIADDKLVATSENAMRTHLSRSTDIIEEETLVECEPASISLGPEYTDVPEYTDNPAEHFYIKEQTIMFKDNSYIISDVVNFPEGKQKLTCQEFGYDYIGNVRITLWNYGDNDNTLTEEQL